MPGWEMSTSKSIQTVSAKPSQMLSNAAVIAHIGGALTGRTLLWGPRGVLVPFDFRGISSSGSSNPRLLPIKTWHSATAEIHGLSYEAGIPVPAPLLQTDRSRTQSTSCGIPPARVQRRHLAHFQLPLSGYGMYKCTDGRGLLGSATLCFCREPCRQIRLFQPCGLWTLLQQRALIQPKTKWISLPSLSTTLKSGHLKHLLHQHPVMLESLNGLSAAVFPQGKSETFSALAHAEVPQSCRAAAPQGLQKLLVNDFICPL